jgi:hypothetical protein
MMVMAAVFGQQTGAPLAKFPFIVEGFDLLLELLNAAIDMPDMLFLALAAGLALQVLGGSADGWGDPQGSWAAGWVGGIWGFGIGVGGAFVDGIGEGPGAVFSVHPICTRFGKCNI